MLNKIFSGRSGYMLGFVASFGLVAAALYLQQKHGLEPCPLCISQRILFMSLGLAFLLAAIHNPAQLGRRIYGVLQFIIAAAGAAVAARHVWIQANPDKVMAECGAGFDYIFETFPMKKALDLVFKGTGECSTVDWTFLGFSMPQLALASFVVLALYAVLLATLKKA